jgi:predicted nucleic-acid-binding Zn-ribbon protein
MLTCKCPKCGESPVREHEIGPTLTRELTGFHPRYFNTTYDVYYITEPARKWWTCGTCGWTLPVNNETQLRRFLEVQDEAG